MQYSGLELLNLAPILWVTVQCTWAACRLSQIDLMMQTACAGGYGSLVYDFAHSAEETSRVTHRMNDVIMVLAPLLMSLILLNFAIGVVLEIYMQQTHLFRALQLRAPAANRLQVRCLSTCAPRIEVLLTPCSSQGPVLPNLLSAVSWKRQPRLLGYSGWSKATAHLALLGGLQLQDLAIWCARWILHTQARFGLELLSTARSDLTS